MSSTVLNPTFTVAAGYSGTITFTMTADGNGSCAAGVDNFDLVVTPSAVVDAGSDEELCQGESLFDFTSQVTGASGSNYASILWTKTGGTGTILNANTLTPTYQLGVGESGVVTFTLTATGNGSCGPAVDNMVLTITPAVVLDAGSDEELCQDAAAQIYDFSTRGTIASASNNNGLLALLAASSAII